MKVLILYTGGTFGMDLTQNPDRYSVDLSVPSLSNNELKRRFLAQVPEIQRLAHCDVEIILNRDSAHIGPVEWTQMAKKIQEKWSSPKPLYDGIVLLHGTDTLAYSAAALSFLLRPCKIPVVITGAQRPLSALRTDARSNLISAVEIAAHGPRSIVKQVTVFFGNQLFQGNRVRKMSASDFLAFDSPQAPPLAVVGTTIRYAASLDYKITNTPKLRPAFDRNILVMHVTPAFPAAALTDEFLASLDGIILVAFHSWTAPTHDPEFLNFLDRAHRRKLPVVIVTEESRQAPTTVSHSMNYSAGKDLVSAGCLSAGTMTPECAYTKTLLLLSQSSSKTSSKASSLSQFKSLWNVEFAGEGH